ncbi:unnamed protein product, partial [Closterium sp. NIES-54]
MVIPGADEPSPELAAAWSAVVARPQSEPERATTALKPPLPPAPKPSLADAEKIHPPAPVAPQGGGAAGPSAPAEAPPVPSAAPAQRTWLLRFHRWCPRLLGKQLLAPVPLFAHSLCRLLRSPACL